MSRGTRFPTLRYIYKKRYAFFNFKTILWTLTVYMKTWNQTLKDNLATICLMAAMFFNPFGFDIVQYWLIQQTESLWKANAILYVIAGCFFGLYIALRTKNKND